MPSISDRNVPARKRWRAQVRPERRRAKSRTITAAKVSSVLPKPQNDAMLGRLERELHATNLLLVELQIQLSALERQRDKLVRRIRLHRKDTTK